MRSSRPAISTSLAFNASAIAFLAASFATGFTFATSVVPAVLAASTASFVVTSGFAISARAFSLSAFTFAIAAVFSASVAFGVLLMAAIWASAAFSTASIAGCLSRVTNSDNGFLSVESSVYVTTRFPALSFSTDLILVLASAASTVLPFLSAKLASSLLLEYSICSFSLILSNSASVTLAGSATATFSVGAAMSYLDV